MAQLFSQVASRLQQVRLQGIGRRFSSVSLHKRLGIWKRGPTKTLQNSCGTAALFLHRERKKDRVALRFAFFVRVRVCVSLTQRCSAAALVIISFTREKPPESTRWSTPSNISGCLQIGAACSSTTPHPERLYGRFRVQGRYSQSWYYT